MAVKRKRIFIHSSFRQTNRPFNLLNYRVRIIVLKGAFGSQLII